MAMQSGLRYGPYWILIAGVCLALVTAVLPHYATGHRLAAELLMVGLLPYFLYGLSTAYLSGWALLLPGLLLLGADLVVKLPAWIAVGQGEIPPALYVTPLVTGLVIFPLYMVLLRMARRGAR